MLEEGKEKVIVFASVAIEKETICGDYLCIAKVLSKAFNYVWPIISVIP